ncbi:unnamed protein product [Caenorhabditis bovis]|uniref:Serpentine receptor class gamma n=1 Tax=Caenorhabditis bovis TaxID=2654633 RepID=A0A8S1FE67_9PELO|nr:unnamed protein product [Caenorhabditis bovis]
MPRSDEHNHRRSISTPPSDLLAMIASFQHLREITLIGDSEHLAPFYPAPDGAEIKKYAGEADLVRLKKYPKAVVHLEKIFRAHPPHHSERLAKLLPLPSGASLLPWTLTPKNEQGAMPPKRQRQRTLDGHEWPGSQMQTLASLPMIPESDLSIPRNLITTVESVQFTLLCITVPFYSVLLLFLIDAQIRNHEWLNSPFFKLCISTAVIDLITMLNNYLGAMFPKWSFFIDFYLKIGNIYGQIYLYIAWTTGCCQAFSVSILAANRLSAVIFPGNYSSMFWYHRIWIPISIQFVPGCLLGIMTLFNPAQLYRNSTNGIVPKFTINKMTNMFYVIGGVVIGSNCIFLIYFAHARFGLQYFAMVCSQYRSILFNPQLFKRCLFGN